MARSKSGVRRKAREFALQMLFQCEMGKQEAAQVRKTFWSHREPVEADVCGFADDLFRLASDRHDEIDALIGKHAQHWRLERMPAVDRNLLRVGAAELLGFPQTPPAVVINEALEIARKFSGPESVQFVNGVLDSISRELINAERDTVSCHQNVTTCQAIVASCFDFSGRRNKVVYSDLNFPSVMYFWEAQRQRGARIQMVATDGVHVDTQRMIDAIDDET